MGIIVLVIVALFVGIWLLPFLMVGLIFAMPFLVVGYAVLKALRDKTPETPPTDWS